MAEVKKKTVTPSASDTAYKVALDKREADRLARISAYQTTGQVQAKPSADLGIINPATGKEYSPVQQGIIKQQQDQGVKFKAPQALQDAGQQLVEDAKAETAKKTGDTHDASGKLLATQEDIENLGAKMEETILGYGKEIGSAISQQLKGFSDGFGMYKDRLQELLGVNLQKGQMFDLGNEVARKELEEAFKGNGEPFAVIQKYSMSAQDYEQRQAEVAEIKQLEQNASARGYDKGKVSQTMDAFYRGQISADDVRKEFNSDPNAPMWANRQADESRGHTADNIPGQNGKTEFMNLTPENVVLQGLENFGNRDMMDLYSMVLSSDPENDTSFSILQKGLIQELMGQEIMSDRANQYFAGQELKALAYYKEARQLAEISREEIDSAIEGKDFVPTTAEGLNAKILTQSKELQLESIEAEKKYAKEQYEIYRAQETDKRSRLEGYLRAKLHASGAQDSSAGLQTMAITVHNADLRLQLQESEFNLGMSRLNTQSRAIMLDFTAKATALVMDTEAKEGQAKNALNDSLDKINENRFLNQKERDKLVFQSFKNYNNAVIDAKEKQREQEWELFKHKYQMTKDAIDQSYKLSGLTGEIHYIDENDNIINTGVPTFDAQKWQGSQLLDKLKLEHQVQNDLLSAGLDLIDRGASPSSVEQMLGLQPGSLSSLKSKDEMKEYAKTKAFMDLIGVDLDGATDIATHTVAGLGGDVGTPILGAYPDEYSEPGSFTSEGLECGEYVWKFADLPRAMGNTLDEKLRNIANTSFPEMQHFEIGDVIIEEGGSTGHVSVVGWVSEDGTRAKVTESNLHLDHKVTNGREIVAGNQRIRGIARGYLKPEYQREMQNMETNVAAVKDGFTQMLDYVSKTGDDTYKQELFTAGAAMGRLPEVLNAFERGKTAGSGAADPKFVQSLRKEVEGLQITKSMNQINKSYSRMQTALDQYENGTISGTVADQAIGMLFNKMLDETSVVRESEFARTTAGQNLLARAEGFYNKYIEGGVGLSDKVREEMVTLSQELYHEAKVTFNDRMQVFVDEANLLNIDPARVLGAYSSDVLEEEEEEKPTIFDSNDPLNLKIF